MAIALGTDTSGNVWLVGTPPMPSIFNGMSIETHVLTATQEGTFKALPPNRGGTKFDGAVFTALLVSPLPDSRMNPTGSGRFVPFGPTGSPFPFVRFYAFNGSTITINGGQYQIPESGVDGHASDATINGVLHQQLAPHTTYYVYAYIDSGIKLEFSTVGWVTDVASGVGIKLNDKTRSIVGLVHTDPSGLFVGNDKSQNTASFFNRVRIGVKCLVDQCFSSVNTWGEPNSNNRISFVCWQDDLPEITVSGTMTNTTTGGHNEVGITVDGALPGSSIAVWDAPSANSSTPFCIKSSSDGGMVEGYHFFGIMMKVAGGTGALRSGVGGFKGETQLIASPVPS